MEGSKDICYLVGKRGDKQISATVGDDGTGRADSKGRKGSGNDRDSATVDAERGRMDSNPNPDLNPNPSPSLSPNQNRCPSPNRSPNPSPNRNPNRM